MRRALVRVLGSLAVVFGLCCVVLALENLPVRAAGGRSILPLAWIGVYFVFGGVGLALRRSWGAIAVSLPAALGGLYLCSSVISVHSWWVSFNIAIGLVLLLIPFSLWRVRRELL